MPQVIVIQYRPDIVKGEFVNIGVLVCDNEFNPKKYAKINAGKIERMASFFEMTTLAACDIVFPLFENLSHWTPSLIENDWRNNYGSIVFCEPRGTVLSIDDALIDARKRYLE